MSVTRVCVWAWRTELPTTGLPFSGMLLTAPLLRYTGAALQALAYTTRPNPHYRSAAPMKL